MAILNINAIIDEDTHNVWDIVFAVEKYSEWRSDLSKTEIINEKRYFKGLRLRADNSAGEDFLN